MREGLDAPTFELPPENVRALRSFLDGQSRLRRAVWVRHEQRGLHGPEYDHHVVLGVADDDWASGDMAALEQGLQLPPLETSEPTWIDIVPLSELDELRSFATVLWEQTSPGGDPLDYRLTYEPFAAEPAALERFVALLRTQPAIRCVGAKVRKLWNGDELVEETVQLVVDAPPPSGGLTSAFAAARESVLADRPSSSASLGRPGDETTAILYEAAA